MEPHPKVIEVLCSKKAFVVKKCANGAPPAEGLTGQITWSRFENVAAAWKFAKDRACFENTP